MEAFESLALALAGFGHTLEAKTKLAYAPMVAKALATLADGGFIAVATEGTSDKYMASLDKLSAENVGKVVVIDARADSYSKVRPHINTYLKTRKVAFGITPPRKGDDGTSNVGFLIRKGAPVSK